MLLNEFIQAHPKIQELAQQQATKFTSTIAEQQQIEALRTGLKKVDKQLQPNSSTIEIAADDY